MVLKALFSETANPSKTTAATDVMLGLIRSSTTNAKIEVMIPPTNSIKPVPIKFRTPSTSLMIRETSTPVLFAS